MAYRRRSRRRRPGKIAKRRFRKKMSKRSTNTKSWGNTKSYRVGVKYNYKKKMDSIFYLPRIGETPRSVSCQYRTQSVEDLVMPSIADAVAAGECRVAIFSGANSVDLLFGHASRQATVGSYGANFEMRKLSDGLVDTTDRKNKDILADVFGREMVTKSVVSMLVRNEEEFSIMVFILPLNRTQAGDGTDRRAISTQAGLVEFINTMKREDLARNPYAKGYVIPARPALGAAQFRRNKRQISVAQYPISAARRIDPYQDNTLQDANSNVVGTGSSISPPNLCGFMIAVVPYETNDTLSTATVGGNLIVDKITFKFNVFQNVTHYRTVASLT